MTEQRQGGHCRHILLRSRARLLHGGHRRLAIEVLEARAPHTVLRVVNSSQNRVTVSLCA